MATYIEGEAPETDSEDEQYLFNLSYMKVRFSFHEKYKNIIETNFCRLKMDFHANFHIFLSS